MTRSRASRTVSSYWLASVLAVHVKVGVVLVVAPAGAVTVGIAGGLIVKLYVALQELAWPFYRRVLVFIFAGAVCTAPPLKSNNSWALRPLSGNSTMRAVSMTWPTLTLRVSTKAVLA